MAQDAIAHTRTICILSSLNIVPWMVGITVFEAFLCLPVLFTSSHPPIAVN